MEVVRRTAENPRMSAHPPESPSAARRLPLPSPFGLVAGGSLLGAEAAVEVYGTLTPARDNAVLLFTGLSASAHAAAHPGDPSAGWWEHMIGSDKGLDVDRLCIICVNSLGSCFGSTGPGSLDPATGAPYGAAFPELRVEDIARAGQAAVEALGIARLFAVVGASLGGMTALAHAVLFPGAARRLVSISGAFAATTTAIATRSLQREIVGSALRRPHDPAAIAEAMRFARKVGVLSYVSGELLEKRFGRDQTEPSAGRASGTQFEVEHWLAHLADKFVAQFDPWAYWYLSRAMDLFDFGAHGKPAGHSTEGDERTPLQRAARKLKLEHCLVIGVHEDSLFPLAQQREIAAVLAGAGIHTTLHELHSPYGHDAFLTETALFTPLLRDALTLSSGAPKGFGAYLPQRVPGATMGR
jgi:homoserine O-acetyltransferase